MKKTLIVLGAALALVGCDQNRGGAGNDSSTDAGASSRDSSYRNMPVEGSNPTNPAVTSPSGAQGSGSQTPAQGTR